MSRKKAVKEKDLLEAIKDSHGFVSTIAERLGVCWHTADTAIKNSPAALEAIKAEEEITLDMVESKALDRIKAEDATMIRFYLATKGKKRGYTYDAPPAAAIAEDTEVNIIMDEQQTVEASE